jgi:hypothetical protein
MSFTLIWREQLLFNLPSLTVNYTENELLMRLGPVGLKARSNEANMLVQHHPTLLASFEHCIG